MIINKSSLKVILENSAAKITGIKKAPRSMTMGLS